MISVRAWSIVAAAACAVTLLNIVSSTLFIAAVARRYMISFVTGAAVLAIQVCRACVNSVMCELYD